MKRKPYSREDITTLVRDVMAEPKTPYQKWRERLEEKTPGMGFAPLPKGALVHLFEKHGPAVAMAFLADYIEEYEAQKQASDKAAAEFGAGGAS